MLQKLTVQTNDTYIPRYRLSEAWLKDDESGQIFVSKTALTKDGQSHLDRIHQSYGQLSGAFQHLTLCTATYDNNALTIPAFESTSLLSSLISESKVSKDAYINLWLEFACAIKPSMENACTFQPSDEVTAMLGSHPQWAGLPAYKSCILDMMPAKISYVRDKGFVLFDHVWCFSSPLPIQFVMYSIIAITYQAMPDCAAPLDDILAPLGIEQKYIYSFQQALKTFHENIFSRPLEGLPPYATPTIDANGAIDALLQTQQVMELALEKAQSEKQQSITAYNMLQYDYQKALSSSSWRITQPLRTINAQSRKIVGCCARTAYKTIKSILDSPIKIKKSRRKLPHQGQPFTHTNAALTHIINPHRIGIYFFYDGKGIVDDYVLFFLKELKKCVDRLVIVSNGDLCPQGRKAMEAFTNEIIVRENKGFDSWALKDAMEHVGYEALGTYDEVITVNNTIMGPVSPLEDMLGDMASKDLDFWGISAHPDSSDNSRFYNPYGYIPAHLQTYFMVYRKAMVRSQNFINFWRNQPPIDDYVQAVSLYETVLTKYFADLGYHWDSFLPKDTCALINDNPLICIPAQVMRNWHCPVFKRRAFFQPYDHLVSLTGTQTTVELLQYLTHETDYNMSMVWQTLLRNYHLYDLHNTMHLSNILPEKLSRKKKAIQILQHKKVGLIMHIHDCTTLPTLVPYLRSMPKETDVYISVSNITSEQLVIQAMTQIDASLTVRVLSHCHCSTTALLVGFADILENYEYICVTQDTANPSLMPDTIYEGVDYNIHTNLLASKDFVYNVIETLECNPHLGLLVPPSPNHGDLNINIGLEWSDHFESTKKLAQQLGINVPMDKDHPSCALNGPNFWARTKALAPLLGKSWQDNDILAATQIYPFAAQQAGYYTATLFTDHYYAIEQGNLGFYAQTYARIPFDKYIRGYFITVRGTLDSMLTKGSGLKVSLRSLKWHLKVKLHQWMLW